MIEKAAERANLFLFSQAIPVNFVDLVIVKNMVYFNWRKSL